MEWQYRNVAIGPSLKFLLEEWGMIYEEINVNCFDKEKYSIVIVNGGLLIRDGSSAHYDIYKLPGYHIVYHYKDIISEDDFYISIKATVKIYLYII